MAKCKHPTILTANLSKSYGAGIMTWALQEVDFRVESGEFVAVVGASGSGKSTLLNIIGALDKPSSGRVFINGCDTWRLDEDSLAVLRGETIGFIFQFHYLLNEFSVLENALMPVCIRKGRATREDTDWVTHLLDRVGLAGRLKSRPNELSGGQQQRAAIVRALANRPKLILADEPTGNLDSKNGAMVFDLLTDLNFQLGTSFVLVTHDDRLAQRADRIVAMEDGRISADYRVGECREAARVAG